ncbi:hypothetical protein OH710_01100 [Pseudomonas capsici]|uniref:hypothetical protein n=1 Tax=Pseudomonas capsici TaxID=2810614 RepID=UPI000E3E5863|nr:MULTISPECIES: hypothetical protein [Pseudomonas]MBX8606120.1 hypothetical protein [Pseudomonas cichorii]MCV4271225.1 hypothetical protein [Pseudomonas capsici]RMO17362.1 hypothetical protein ALQ47_00786 [Pseudomonas cichorii]GFM49320.1 hypothetical protein PSCICE_05870 [Pseudomonas cichorii]GFM59176.1 hypothetical protein PSCICG_03360 [Pseudomonas cichorii]
MLNSNEWQQKHDQFLSNSQSLLYKSEECLSHLEMIGDDEDAIEGLLTNLLKLSIEAQSASIESLADFSRKLQQWLTEACQYKGFSPEVLNTLKSCLELMSWQLELIDPQTGELLMDCEEQQALLAKLSEISNISGQ